MRVKHSDARKYLDWLKELVAEKISQLEAAIAECANLRRKHVPTKVAYKASRDSLDCMESRQILAMDDVMKLIKRLILIVNEEAEFPLSSILE